ncbi:dipeptidyl peptidase IV N-terminal region-domain-containing protein [Chytridium lagenaria]|nr:dipeptidyl peptidase IV N-terminal region-domain-containing protein [Chytridium lagenaria]
MAVLFADFKVSSDLKYLLLEADTEKGWRHSSFANYWVHDIAEKMATPGKISLAVWSPIGHTVAWIRDNDVYVTIDTKNEVKITEDGSKNIINGRTDWVYEEEVLSTNTQLSMYVTKEAYPKTINLKYPKAGSPNPVTTLHIATPSETKKSHRVVEIAFPSESMYPDDDRLIVEVKWLSDTTLFARLMNRVQDSQRLFHIKLSEEGKWLVQMVREEENEDEAWFQWLQPITVIPPSKAIGRMEPSYLELKEDDKGFTHIAYFSSVLQSKPASWLTSGPFEVTKIDAVDYTTGTVYYTSTQEGFTQRHLYSVQLDGTMKKKLTPLPKGIDWGASVRTYNTTRPKSKESQGTFGLGTLHNDDGLGDEVGTVGYYEAKFSPEGSYCILSYKGPDVPFQVVVKMMNDAEAGPSVELVSVIDRHEEIHKALKGYAMPREWFTTVQVPSLDASSPMVDVGVKLIVPIDFDGSGAKKYPMVVKVYGGPGSQMVKQVYDVGFETGLAASGFVVAIIDPRGTGFRGRAFRSIVSKELGNFESHDVTEATKAIIEKGFIDDKKVAVWGWSYGGYLTSKIIERNSGVFATPASNPKGYEMSAVTRMDGFKNSYFLLMHGMADGSGNTGLSSSRIRISIYAGGANAEVYALLLDYMVEKMDVKVVKPVPKKPVLVKREEEWFEVLGG